MIIIFFFFFFFSSRRRHTSFDCDWSSDVCSSDLASDLHEADSRIEARSENSGCRNDYTWVGHRSGLGRRADRRHGTEKKQHRIVLHEWSLRILPPFWLSRSSLAFAASGPVSILKDLPQSMTFNKCATIAHLGLICIHRGTGACFWPALWISHWNARNEGSGLGRQRGGQ